MSVDLQIETYQMQINQIVEDVFRLMMSLDVSQSELPGAVAAFSLTAEVQFVGAWKGAVLLQCSPEQAVGFTSRLLPGLEPSGVDVDVRDSLGELANMVAGNLKAVLPAGVALSMPSVVEGSDYEVHHSASKTVKTLSFSSELGIFQITLLQAV